MTAPTYVGTPTTSGSSVLGTTHSITLPSGIVAGERIVVIARFHMDQNAGTFTVTTPTDFNFVTGLNPGPAGPGARIIDRCWAKTAVGTEGGTTISVTTNVVAVSAMVAVREDLNGTGFSGVYSSGFTGFNPASLTWGAAYDTHSVTWLACVDVSPGSSTPVAPTGYSILVDIYSSATGFGGGSHNGHARVTLADASPGVVTTVDPDDWTGYAFGLQNMPQPFHGIERNLAPDQVAYWGILAIPQ